LIDINGAQAEPGNHRHIGGARFAGCKIKTATMRGYLRHAPGDEGGQRLSSAPAIAIAALSGEPCRSAEADHRIANHLALLSAYVRLKATDLASQPAEPSRASVRLVLDGVCAQIGAISRLHRSLAAEGEGASADLAEHLHGICIPFMSGLCGQIELIEDFRPGCVVRPDQILPLTQIVVEVVTNAVKHAHVPGEPGAILARCRQGDDGAVLVEIIDDGAGLPEAFDPRVHGGLGFRLLRALGRRLGARIAFESAGRGTRRPGTHFRLTLPPAHA
jgi:two-component sensor histidine kinase